MRKYCLPCSSVAGFYFAEMSLTLKMEALREFAEIGYSFPRYCAVVCMTWARAKLITIGNTLHANNPMVLTLGSPSRSGR
jgi:hypothetical protein